MERTRALTRERMNNGSVNAALRAAVVNLYLAGCALRSLRPVQTPWWLALPSLAHLHMLMVSSPSSATL
eukprot:scaffold379389_cov20-Prasinocladus_malaysianus.AAC.1